NRVLGGNGIIAPGAGNHVTINGILRPGMESEGALRFDMSGESKLDFTAGSSIELTLGTESTLIAFLTSGDWLSGSGSAEINLTLGSGFSYGDSYTLIQGVSTADFGFAAVGGYDTH